MTNHLLGTLFRYLLAPFGYTVTPLVTRHPNGDRSVSTLAGVTAMLAEASTERRAHQRTTVEDADVGLMVIKGRN